MEEPNSKENSDELDSNYSYGTLTDINSAISDTNDSENFTLANFVDKKKRAAGEENYKQNYKKIKIAVNDNLLQENDDNYEKKCCNGCFLECIKTLRIENKIYFQKIMQQINSIKQTVNAIQTQVLEMKTESCDNFANVPEKPFDNKDEFINFDKSLIDDTEKMNGLKRNFVRCGGEDVDHFIKKNLRKLMTDEVAKYFCWSGTDNKRSVKNYNSILTLKNVCLSSIKCSTETKIDYHIKRFFQYARQRIYLTSKSKDKLK